MYADYPHLVFLMPTMKIVVKQSSNEMNDEETNEDPTEASLEDEGAESNEPNEENSSTTRSKDPYLRTIISQFISSYFEQTTVHGFKYVVTGASKGERFAWMVFVAFAFLAAFLMIGTYTYEAISNPITISLSTIPVTKVPFPAVTVDSGKAWNPMGYPRKALARSLPDENRKG